MMPNEPGAAEPSAEMDPTYASGAPPGEPMEPMAGPAATPKKGSRGIMAVVVIVVAVIVVVAALYLVGVGPFHRNSANSGSTVSSGATYDTARSQAEQAAGAYGSGSWSVLFAGGVDLSSSVLLSTALPSDLFTSAGISGCVGTAEDTSTATTLLAFTGNFSSGQAPDWMFFLVNAQGTVASATVVNGQATIWEVYQGSGCSVIGTVLGSVPSSAVDSPTAVSAAMGDGGSGAGTRFMSDHPGGYLSVSAWAGGAWYVDYTTCPAIGNGTAGTTYYEYNASVGFTSGKIIGTASSGTAKCSGLDLSNGISNIGQSPGSTGGTALDTAFAIGSPILGSGGNWDLTIQSVGAGMTIADIEVAVLNATTGKTVSDPYAVELYAVSGCGLAIMAFDDPYYLAPFSGACTTGPTGGASVLDSGETFSVLTLTSGAGAGDDFVVYGEGSFSGNITVVL
jgi:hypothetical protein